MDITTSSWADLKSIITSKMLLTQYYNNGVNYIVWAVDPPVAYYYNIYLSGFEPIGSDTTQIASDRTDFETNFKPTANQPVFLNQSPIVQSVTPTNGSRCWTFFHLFNDKTTWFGDSILVTSETLGTGDGSTVTFSFANSPIIDVTHGKITQEDDLVPTAAQVGSSGVTSYAPVIQVNSTTLTEQEFGETGGDYTIDYAAGTITFATAPASSAAITALSYFYSPASSGSTMYIRPPSGQIMFINEAEAQFSADITMTDNLIVSMWTYNPELGAPPEKFEYPGSRARFKKMSDFINWTNGAWPSMPPFAGTRGYTQNSYQLTFDYNMAVSLNDAYGAELRVWLEHHTPFTGEYATITYYGYTIP